MRRRQQQHQKEQENEISPTSNIDPESLSVQARTGVKRLPHRKTMLSPTKTTPMEVATSFDTTRSNSDNLVSSLPYPRNQTRRRRLGLICCILAVVFWIVYSKGKASRRDKIRRIPSIVPVFRFRVVFYFPPVSCPFKTGSPHCTGHLRFHHWVLYP